MKKHVVDKYQKHTTSMNSIQKLPAVLDQYHIALLSIPSIELEPGCHVLGAGTVD